MKFYCTLGQTAKSLELLVSDENDDDPLLVMVSTGKMNTKLAIAMGLSEKSTALTFLDAPPRSWNYKHRQQNSHYRPHTPTVNDEIPAGT